jgi:hypothetical protein
MLASYIFDYVQIYFNNYLKHKNVIFKIFKIEGSLESSGAKLKALSRSSRRS